MKTTVKILVVAITLTFLNTAEATVSELIPVQGVLSNSSNDNPVNGMTDMRFDLYGVKTGGTALWESLYDVSTKQVNVDNGYFVVYLGELSAYPLDFNTLLGESQLWLQLTVNGEVMDRIRIASVAFSEEAQYCSQIGDMKEGDIQPFLGSPCNEGYYFRGWNAATKSPICEPDRIEPVGGNHYYNISGCDVIFEHSNDQSVRLSNYCEVYKDAASSHTNVFAAVHLPDGVTVKAVRSWVKDNNSKDDNCYVRVILMRRSITEGETLPQNKTMTDGHTSTQSTDIQMIESTAINVPVIDNEQYDYYLYIVLGNTGAYYKNMSFFKTRIEYTY